MKRRTVFLGAILGLGVAGAALWQPAPLLGLMNTVRGRLRSTRTVEQVVADFGPAARARLAPAFDAAGVAYPPPSLTLIGLKAERRLELWAPNASGQPVRLLDYRVIAASGGPGPKLREGDRQVPEGLYRITFLNANSRFHLSLRIGYPNAEDRARAAAEGRTDLGGDIMIHGAGGSIGCLALTNEAIEELFVLAAEMGIEAIQVILVPHDLRGHPVPPVPDGAPAWMADRYRDLHAALAGYVALAAS